MRRPLRVRAVTMLSIAALVVAAPGCTWFATGTLGEATNGTSVEGTTNGQVDNSWFISSMVVVGLTVVGGVIGLVSALERAVAYLDENRRDIRIALARGEGPFVTDLADALHLGEADLQRVGQALQAHQRALDGFLVGPIDEARARAFFASVAQALGTDPVLATSLDALRERHARAL